MAAVVGDYATSHSGFYTMITGSGLQHGHSNPHMRESAYRSCSSTSSSRPREYRTASLSSVAPTKRSWDSAEVETGTEEKGKVEDVNEDEDEEDEQDEDEGGSTCIKYDEASSASTGLQNPRFLTPPESTSPDPAGARKTGQSEARIENTPAKVNSTPTLSQQQPSPESETSQSPASPRESIYNCPITSEVHTIAVRDLAHIQSLVQADLINETLNDSSVPSTKYDVSGMPIADIIEMVAALLTKITSTNDLQHDAIHRSSTHQQNAAQGEKDLSSSVLAFHGKNVPAITILSYLSRIHKYCPTTYEVFLSLLVYFDRMTERVNHKIMQEEEISRRTVADQGGGQPPDVETSSTSDPGLTCDVNMNDGESDDSDETDSDLADDEQKRPDLVDAVSSSVVSPVTTYFVVDSFNIHRLIIAGVTSASKFFSDIFYTNSRYAKVGGLPLAELNHLELQFLLLNDFRLAVPVEDLDAYSTMLVEFYAREVLASDSRNGPV